MVEVSDALKEAFLNHSENSILISFSNGTTVDETSLMLEDFELEQSICEEESLKFGSCGSNSVKFTMKNDNQSHIDLTFTVTITAYDYSDEAHENGYPFSLGTFKVYEDSLSDDRGQRSIVAYDSLYEVLSSDYADWYHSLNLETTPITLKAFRDSFFQHIGIVQESVNLINDDFIVSQTINTESLTGQDILQAICEINAVFGNIGYDGKFRYITTVNDFDLYPRDDLYPSDDLYPEDGNVCLSIEDANYLLGTFVYQDYVCGKITSVRIVEDDSDDGTVVGDNEYDDEEETIVEEDEEETENSVTVGSGDNQYVISGNFLLFGSDNTQRTTIGERFLAFCKDFFYVPAKIEMRSHLWIEPGDLVQVIGQTNAIVFPVLHRVMTGISALKDSYEAKGVENYANTESTNSISSQFEKYKSKTMKMERNVDAFYQEYQEFETVTDGTLESHSTRIEQTPHYITMSISGAIGKTDPTSATITLGYLDENGDVITDEQDNPLTTLLTGIKIDGSVVFASQLYDGVTRIDGANITTGRITSNDGTMIIDLDNNQITANTLIINSTNFKVSNTGLITAASAKLNRSVADYFLELRNTDLNDSTYLHTGGVYGAYEANTICVSKNTSFNGDAHMVMGKLSITQVQNNIWYRPIELSGTTITISENSTTRFGHLAVTGDTFYFGTNTGNDVTFRPNTSGATVLGTGTYYWKEVHCATGGYKENSDRKLKDVVENLTDDENLEDFIMSLEPVMYTLKDSTAKRHHMGFIAQDVAETSKNTLGDLSLFSASVVNEDGDEGETYETYFDKDINDENLIWSLSYTEFIAPMLAMIQKQNKRIEQLEKELNELKKEI